jgi:hypothetical protein
MINKKWESVLNAIKLFFLVIIRQLIIIVKEIINKMIKYYNKN